MTTKQLENIYAMTCAAKGFEPNDPQFKVWKITLGWFEAKDLESAIGTWFSGNANFPMPSDLKPLIIKAKNERESKNRDPGFYSTWECVSCGSRTGGWGEYPPKHCRATLPVPKGHDDYGKVCASTHFNLEKKIDAKDAVGGFNATPA